MRKIREKNREKDGEMVRRRRRRRERDCGWERAETQQRQKRLQEEWGGLRRGCRGPRAVSTTPNPDARVPFSPLSLSLSLSFPLSSVFATTTTSTPMTSKRFHARTRPSRRASSLALSRVRFALSLWPGVCAAGPKCSRIFDLGGLGV